MISINISLVLYVCTDSVSSMISVMEGAGGRQTSTEKAGESDVLEIREDKGEILAYFQKTGDSSELDGKINVHS